MSHPVIVGVDDPQGSSAAVDWAADEARLSGLRLHLVHGLPWYHRPDSGSLAEQLVHSANREALRALANQAADRHPGLEVTSGLVDVSAREALVHLSAGAAMVVVGTRGAGGFPGLLVGSTSLYVTAQAACPVVVVPGAHGSRRGVAVGVHGGEPCGELLAFAFEEAQRRELPLRVVHAWSHPLIVGSGHAFPPLHEEGQVVAEQVRLLAGILTGWREKYPGVAVTEDIVRSGAAKRLVEVSATQQLLVVGRHGHPNGPVGRLGSVSQAVVHHAHCPVAVLPAP
ncbi:universal stress protein [Streptacidiphilus albus]|uniref:universal stress protein n=1 Tax=Streptacidiphilus albus TaxID=105425 RepID=UPI00054C46D1|nr:universal stress protein [Streptacidiphilus albus]